MRRTYFNKIICFVFATILTVTSVFVVPASAASADEVADKIIISRIEELERQFSNQYFTVNQKGCRYWESGHGCSNCYSGSIVNTAWFKSKANSLSWVNNNFDSNRVSPSIFYGNGCSYTCSGWSCHGYATTMFSLLFNDVNNGGRIDVYNAGTYSFNYSSMYGKVLPGDVLRLDRSHTVLVISVQSNSLEVLDCNSNYTGYNCYVRRRTIPYSYYNTATITRPTNRNSITGTSTANSTYNTYNNSKPTITSGSGYRVSGEYAMRVYWQASNCDKFEVSYLTRSGYYTPDTDYTATYSTSFMSRDIVRSMRYRVIGINSRTGARSDPYYIDVSF